MQEIFKALIVAVVLVSIGCDSNSNRELIDAILDSDEKAMLLISKGADVNAKDKDGMTPLHAAAAFNAKNVAELLIAKGAE